MRIGVVTTSRADYGIYRPILRALQAADGLEPVLYVGGSHLLAAHGTSIEEIERDGFTIAARVPCLMAGDSAGTVARSMGLATMGFAAVYEEHRPDWLMVLGDRYEMFAATIAAVPFNLPIVHLHGGEVTNGAIDDAFRHGISKCAHLHCVSTENAARRLQQLGEAAWRVHVTGAPALDNLADLKLLTATDLAQELGLALDVAPLVVTYHPVTRHPETAADDVQAMLDALATECRPIVITGVNADTAAESVRARLNAFAATRDNVAIVANLGMRRYFSLCAVAVAMVGNSSSGILEAASFRLPVVNIGDRQAGRERARNVVDVPCETSAIRAALDRALTPDFRASLRDLRNPYGDGHAALRVVDALRATPIDGTLISKHFQDVTWT